MVKNANDKKVDDKKVDEKKSEPAKEKLPEFYIAPGKSVTTKTRGIVGTEKKAEKMTEIKVEDLAGGEEALNALGKAGIIKHRDQD